MGDRVLTWSCGGGKQSVAIGALKRLAAIRAGRALPPVSREENIEAWSLREVTDGR